VVMSVRVDSRLSGSSRLYCSGLELVDETGDRWGTSWSDGFSQLDLVPGTPVLETAAYMRPSRNESEARVFDLSGTCRLEFQGRRATIPITLTGLRVSQ
jgi:hypothetical protein